MWVQCNFCIDLHSAKAFKKSFFSPQISVTIEKPVMIFEIKMATNAVLARVSSSQLAQALLEGCYCCICNLSHTIVVCLTDVTTWHFIKVKYTPDELLTVLGVTSVIVQDDYAPLMKAMMGMILQTINEEDII